MAFDGLLSNDDCKILDIVLSEQQIETYSHTPIQEKNRQAHIPMCYVNLTNSCSNFFSVTTMLEWSYYSLLRSTQAALYKP